MILSYEEVGAVYGAAMSKAAKQQVVNSRLIKTVGSKRALSINVCVGAARKTLVMTETEFAAFCKGFGVSVQKGSRVVNLGPSYYVHQ